jgi:hypothetical protein
MEDVAKICVDFDFEEEKIDEYLRLFETDEKYKGIPAYEWQQTKTREQKMQERKRKILEEEMAKRRARRERQMVEERERRR